MAGSRGSWSEALPFIAFSTRPSCFEPHAVKLVRGWRQRQVVWALCSASRTSREQISDEIERVASGMVAGLALYAESVRRLIATDEPPVSPERTFDESLLYHLLQNTLRFKAAGLAAIDRRAAVRLWSAVRAALDGYLGAVAHLLEVERALVTDPASRLPFRFLMTSYRIVWM